MRARIARALLTPEPEVTLGAITLRPHQCEAAARVRAALDGHGGALLADDVGLGKTFVALAIAAGAQNALVVAPASLRAMWTEAGAKAQVPLAFRSYEALSRGSLPALTTDLVVMDEAHHARNPRTARYRHLAQTVAGARVLLLSATPVHNTTRDMRALIALYLGARAWTLEESELAAHVIRREHDDVPVGALPALAPPEWVTAGVDEALRAAIVALPPPVGPAGGGDGGALLSFTLARLWASSHAALRGGLWRRLQRARALQDALACGRHPTAAELRAWTLGDDAAQLAFPQLISVSTADDVTELEAAVREHTSALQRLLNRVPDQSELDRERAARLLETRARHPGDKIVAFTQFSDTARMYFRCLRHAGHACQLDGRGARVAGGRLSRREALARFAPRASGAREASESERIDLLITTDILSEGVNLQDASVVVHLDLPWTPARLEQRVGRSRRLDALHATTRVYAFEPPASAESLLKQEQRLHAKMQTAARLTGACGAILPVRLCLAQAPFDRGESPAPARATQRLRTLLRRWGSESAVSLDGAIPVACVQASRAGALALVRRGALCELVALLGANPSEHPSDVLAAAQLADGPGAPCREHPIANAVERIEAWLAHTEGTAVAGLALSITGPARRVAMRRIAHIAAHTPHHRRAVVATLAAEARRIITAPYGVGAERILAELADAPLPDVAWLRAVRAFGEANTRAGTASHPPGALRLEALIVFGT
ncbi:MAG: helicase-related protein [Gemmatimonadaceae bacterium]